MNTMEGHEGILCIVHVGLAVTPQRWKIVELIALWYRYRCRLGVAVWQVLERRG